MKKHSKKLSLALLIFCIALIGSVSVPATEQKVYAATKKAKLAAPKGKWRLSDDNILTVTWKKVPKAKGYTVWIYREDDDVDDLYYLETKKDLYDLGTKKNASLKYTYYLGETAFFYKIVVKAFSKSNGKKVYGKSYTKELATAFLSYW